MINKEYILITSKEIKGVKAYIHSKNMDGSFNVCFNLDTINPRPHHLHKYHKLYLEKYYQTDGVLKWEID